MVAEDVKELARLLQKATDVIEDVTKVMRQQADVMKLLSEKILALENRQDTLWAALQGVVNKMNKG